MPLVRKVIASGIEVVDIDAWNRHIMQVLVQTLLRCQISTVRKMIVELVASKILVNILILLGILPFDIKQVAIIPYIVQPAFFFSSSLNKLILRSETQDYRVLFFALR